MKRLFVCLLFLLCFTLDADAANKFWVGGGSSTNWNAAGNTNWALTSGGAGNQAIPVAGDSVFFDGNSGTGAAVWNTTISLVTLDCTGSKNPITHSAAVALTISSGNLVLPTGVGGTYTASANTSSFTFSGTSGTQQIRTNSFLPGSITLNGVGGTFQLQDNLTMFSNVNTVIQFTNGTFDAQTFTVTTPTFTANGAGTRTLIGSGLFTVGTANALGNVWAGGGTITLTGFTSNITVTGTTTGIRTFTGGGLTYQGRITILPNTSQGLFQVVNANTFTNFTVTGPNFLTFSAGVTLTFLNPPIITGSFGNEVGITSSTVDISAGWSLASGTTAFTWGGFRDMTFSGGATFAATNSFDLGRVTGMAITAPVSFVGGSTACILGGWLLWRDLPQHINDNYPAWIDKAA